MKAMKRHIIPLLFVLTSTIALCGCSKDELLGTEPTDGNTPAATFTITVSDGGYISSDADPHTRASENAYQTNFVVGDRIGVFAVKNGKIIEGIKNLCLTAQKNGNSLKWTDASGNAPFQIHGVTYYAYYPYRFSLKGSVKADANDANNFFADIINQWELNTNQGTYANYTAQDLMVAQGTLIGKSLSFSMQHKMALVVIELPKRASYKLSNMSYTWPASSVLEKEFTGFIPYSMEDGRYRYLVKPSGNELSGSYPKGDKSWKFSPSVSAGKYRVFKVDGGLDGTVELVYTPAIGDFYMKDGSLVGKDEELSEPQKKSCIGVVFWVGDATVKDKTLKTDYPNCTHGLVVALQDAIPGGGTTKWMERPYPSHQDWLNSNGYSNKYLEIRSYTGKYDRLNNIQGYNNTRAIEEYNSANSDNPAKPIVKVQEYRTTVPTPQYSSVWYLPSAKELSLLCSGDKEDIWEVIGIATIRDLLNNGPFNKLGSYAMKFPASRTGDFVFISSTESARDGGSMYSVDFSHGGVNGSSKANQNRVRCVLAF